jgi:hypothetical protein
MAEKEKLSAIKDYLTELFPGCVIENMWDATSGRYMFHVCVPTGETKHTIGVASDFLSDNELEDIVISLKLDNLKAYLEMFGNKEVLVTNDGINPQGTRPSVIH